MNALTLFVDGACPLCTAQAARLRSWDRAGRLAFTDISLPGFDPAPYGTTLDAMRTELHGVAESGRLLAGMDCIAEACRLTGRGWLAWPLRVRALRPLLAASYRLLARHRYRVSRLFGFAPPPCHDGACALRRR